MTLARMLGFGGNEKRDGDWVENWENNRLKRTWCEGGRTTSSKAFVLSTHRPQKADQSLPLTKPLLSHAR